MPRLRSQVRLLLLTSFLICLSASLIARQGCSTCIANTHLLFAASIPYDSAIQAVFLGLLVVLLARAKLRFNQQWLVAVIIGAGGSNLLEKLMFGAVIDYLPGLFGSQSNVADWILVVSSVAMVVTLKGTQSHAEIG